MRRAGPACAPQGRRPSGPGLFGGLLLAAALLGLFRFSRKHRSYPAELRDQWRLRQSGAYPYSATPSSSGLGAYYVRLIRGSDSPTVSEAEEHGLSAGWEPPVRLERTDHPVEVACAGINAYNRYVSTGDPRFLERAKKDADWLLGLQQEDGSWLYNFDYVDLHAPWRSALAQGQGISLLLRVREAMGGDEYLAAAKRAYEVMVRPVDQGGTLGRFEDGSPMLQEYVGSERQPAVLNGAIFAWFGLRDYGLVTNDQGARDLERTLADAMAARLEEWETGDWTKKDLHPQTPPASWGYHRMHMTLAMVMNAITGDDRWGLAAERWVGFLEARQAMSPFAFWRENTLFRVWEIADRLKPEGYRHNFPGGTPY